MAFLAGQAVAEMIAGRAPEVSLPDAFRPARLVR